MVRFSLAELLSCAAGVAVACAVVWQSGTIPLWLVASGALFVMACWHHKFDRRGPAISFVAIGWTTCLLCGVISMLDCFQVSNQTGQFRSRYARACFFGEFSFRFGFASAMSAPILLSIRSIVVSGSRGKRLVLLCLFFGLIDTAILVLLLEYLVSFDWTL